MYGNGTAASSIIHYECDPGYNLAGIAVIRCLPNGQWSSPPPLCQGAQCSTPPQIVNGRLTVKPPYYTGQSVEVECSTGYQFAGSTTAVTCLEDKLFSSAPQCKDVDECEQSDFVCNTATTRCINTDGSYECRCREGLEPALQCKPYGQHLRVGGFGPNRVFVSGSDNVHTKMDFGLINDYGWCAQDGGRQWITVDLKAPTIIDGVQLKSGKRRDGLVGFITLFSLDYSDDNVNFKPFVNSTTQQQYVIVGLIDGHDNSPIKLPEVFEARYIRLIVEQFNAYPCVRLDYIGCQKSTCRCESYLCLYFSSGI